MTIISKSICAHMISCSQCNEWGEKYLAELRAKDAEIEELKKERAEHLDKSLADELFKRVQLNLKLDAERSRTAALVALLPLIERAYLYPIDISRYFPQEKENTRGACGIGCDMGDCGYSQKGPGHHDDDCLVKKIYEAFKDGGKVNG